MLSGLLIIKCAVPLLLVIGCLLLPRCSALRLLQLQVPTITDFRDAATLSCAYDLAGNTLNSVKWYKDGNEFFRFAPAAQPPVRLFAVAGVQVATVPPPQCTADRCSIRLHELRPPQSNGAYRCEISGDAPEFKLAHRTSNMTVAALPRYPPDIGGLAGSYAFGSRVVANCTTDRSDPAATISWFLNNVPLSAANVRQQPDRNNVDNDAADDDDDDRGGAADFGGQSPIAMRSRSQEASFTVDRGIWGGDGDGDGGDEQLHVKCVATVDGWPQLLLERVHSVRLTSDDRLNNDRLVNVKGGADRLEIIYETVLVGIAFAIGQTIHARS